MLTPAPTSPYCSRPPSRHWVLDDVRSAVSEPEVVVSAYAEPAEREVEATLRPRTLAEFVGQPRVREQLELVLHSALRRGKPPDHVLLSGPPGLGKT
ncbi:MAG: Holliday junction branch migration DNA helicase RuvB, partial [Pseudonocardiales bacterium]